MPGNSVFLITTINSLLSLSNSKADGGGGSLVDLPRRNSSNCLVSSSTLATAKDNSFSFSLNNARIESRSLAVDKKLMFLFKKEQNEFVKISVH